MKVMNVKSSQSDREPIEFLQINATGIASLRDHKLLYDKSVEELRILRENGRNDWQIMFVICGTLDVYTENGILEAKENDICVFPPKIKNDYVFKVNNEGYCTAAYYIHYTGTAIDDIMEKTGIAKIAISKNMRVETRRQFELVLKLHKSNEKYSALGTLLLILSSLKSQDGGEITDYIRRIHEAADYITLHYTDNINIDACAEHCKMSRSRFAHLFKEEFGIPPYNYMLKLRLEHATDLLKFSTIPINEISRQCGFPDPYYFARLFSKNFGVSPSNYRKKSKEEQI